MIEPRLDNRPCGGKYGDIVQAIGHTPLVELKRLYEKAHERFIPFARCFASQARPWGVLDRQAIEDEIARHAARNSS